MYDSSQKQAYGAVGPLYKDRHFIVQSIVDLPVRTGDILVRLGDESYYGLPFSQLVAYLTKSKYSHTSIVLVENNEVYCIEVNEDGTRKYLLVDWIDFAKQNGIALYRVNYLSCRDLEEIEKQIKLFLQRDPDYDFTFSNDENSYCTESVVDIYNKAGIHVFNGYYVSDVLKSWKYIIFLVVNFICKKLIDAYIPTDKLMYFVGNEQLGMLAERRLVKLYEYK